MTDHTSFSVYTQYRFFGLDVHKKTIVIAQAEATGEPHYITTIANDANAVKRFFSPLLKEGLTIHTVYEAGACGYPLHRQLEGLGVHNIICAPSKIAKAPGKKVKNDKVDAILLARLLRAQIILAGHDELHEVYVPNLDDEAMREKNRQREAFKKVAKVTQNQIMCMLQRHNKKYTLTINAWTKTYREWLKRVDFESPLLNDTFRVYLDSLEDLESRVRQCDKELNQLCETWNKAELVRALRSLRGIQVLTASNLVAEIGNFSRFRTPRDLMAYIGLTPSESSSGDSVTKGRITKTGNRRVRTLVVEAANNAGKKPKPKAAFIAACPQDVPEEIKEHAYKAQCRLYTRYWALVNKGKRSNVAKIAVAREMLGFIWAIGVMVELAMANRALQEQTAA